MNCDQVFDILTRGPFPTGNPSDDLVERHLVACHPCRQLADALRPAVELFHEAIAIEESRLLPGYRGLLFTTQPQRLPPAINAANQATVVPPAALTAAVPSTVIQPAPAKGKMKASRCSGSRIGQFAAATLLGISLCALSFSLGSSSKHGWLSVNGERGPWPQTSGPVRYLPSESGQQMLAALAIPAECFQLGAEPAMAPVIDSHGKILLTSMNQHTSFFCCQHCHVKASSKTPRGADNQNGSCQACHDR